MNLSQCAATVARHLSATTLFSGSLSTTLRGCNGIGMVSIIFAYPLVQVALAAEPTASEPLLHHCLVSLVEEAKVPSREAGVLFEIVVREGDTIDKDQMLARIDDTQPQFEKRKAMAEHEQTLGKAESDVDIRYSISAEAVAAAELKKAVDADKRVPGSVTQVERDRLELNERKAELQIEQAELERRLATLTAQAKEVEVDAAISAISRRVINSPLAGIVVQVYPHLGEWVQPGDPVARVVRIDKLRIEGYVDSARWNPDQIRDRPVTVQVVLADKRIEEFSGRIVYTSPIVESGGDYRVWAEVENRQHEQSNQWLLRAGQTAEMTVHSSKPSLSPVPSAKQRIEDAAAKERPRMPITRKIVAPK